MKNRSFAASLVVIGLISSAYVANAATLPAFTHNLKYRSVSSEVKALQQFLNQHNFFVATKGSGSAGKETTFYGLGTKAALTAFQNANAASVLAPLGLSRGTGIFSTLTRNFVNGLLHPPATNTPTTTPKTTFEVTTDSVSSTHVERFTISGSISGVSGGVILENNHSDQVTVASSTLSAFTFSQTLLDGQVYEVTVKQAPAGLQCSASAGGSTVDIKGIVHGINVTDIHIQCALVSKTKSSIGGASSGGSSNGVSGSSGGGGGSQAVVNTTSRFTIGGSISNLIGTLQLRNNFSDTLTVSSSSSFVFATSLTNGQSYSASVLTQPIGQTCRLTGGSDVVDGTNVSSIHVACQSITVMHTTDLVLTNPLIGTAYPLSDYVSSTSPEAFNGSVTGSSAVIVSGQIVIAGYGTSTIQVTQDATSLFSAASATLLVVSNPPIAPVITNFNNITKTYGDIWFSPSASSTSPAPITFTLGSAGVAFIGGNFIFLQHAGTTTIDLFQPAVGNFTSASRSVTLTVNGIIPFISFPDITVTDYDGSLAPIEVTSSNSGAFTFYSSNESVATPDLAGSLEILGSGTSTITAVQPAFGDYLAATATAELTVSASCSAATFCDQPGDYPVSTSTCSFSSGGAISCGACQTGMTGGECNIAINMCATLPCSPNGVCTRTSTFGGLNPPLNSYACTCNLGYYGSSCQFIDTRPTPTITFDSITKYIGDAPFSFAVTSTGDGPFSFQSSNTSVATVSGGVCTVVGIGTSTITAHQTASDISSFTSGSQTTLMSVYANYCTDNPGTCQNGGTCSPDGSSYTCSCLTGFTGTNCEDVTNYCLSNPNPCQNAGICLPSGAGFSCFCTSGHNGDLCQETPSTSACYSSSDAPDACSSHGTCTPSGGGGTCACDPCFMGPTCNQFDVLNCA